MKTIRTRLLLAFIILAVFPLGLTGVLVSVEFFNTSRQGVSQLQETLLERVEDNLSGLIRQRQKELSMTILEFQLEETSEKHLRFILNRLIFFENTYVEILLLDAEGNILVREHQYQVISPETPLSFDPGPALDSVAKTGSPWLGPVRFLEDTGQPVMEIAMPIMDLHTGRLSGLLLGSFRMTRIWELLASLDLSATQSVYILDGKGQVIAHPNPTMVLRQTRFDPGNRDRGLLGDPVLMSTREIRMENQTFTLVAEISMKEAMKAGVATVRLVLLIIIGALLMAVATAFLLIGNIVSPLSELSAAAAAVQAGDMSQRIRYGRDDEIGLLADAFNSMTGHLEISMKELRNLQQLFRSIIDFMPSVIAAVDSRGLISQWNRTAENLTGVGSAEARGREVSLFFPQIGTLSHSLQMALSEGRVMEQKISFQQDGMTRVYSITVYPLLIEDERGAVVRMDDITEIEKREEQLIQIQKMEIVGTLAGGLVHDFNNILAGIVGTLTILYEKLENRTSISSEELTKDLAIMESASDRAIELVHRLLTLSRKAEQNLQVVDLNDVIGSAVEMCVHSLDRSIALVPRGVDQPALVYADRGQLEQILLNFLINAGDAMTIMRMNGEPWGGTITITIDRVSGSDEFFRLNPQTGAAVFWKLAVEDQGVGMDEEAINRIFTPFYTTKKEDEGTGLGLAMVFSLIRQNNGFVHVHSEAGRGSVFSIYLPEHQA